MDKLDKLDKLDKQIMETKISRLENILFELDAFIRTKTEPDIMIHASEKTWQGILMFKRMIKD